MQVSDPQIQQPDAIVRLTASAIWGTDLPMIWGTMPGMTSRGWAKVELKPSR